MAAERIQERQQGKPIRSRAIPAGARQAIADAATVLAGVPPFSELPPVDRAKLAAALEEVTFDEGDVIFAEGAAADGLYILRDGLIERRAGGVKLATLTPPSVFGDLALLTSELRSATLVAASPCVVWRLPADRFTRLLKTQPGIGARFAAAVSARLASTQREVAELAQDFEAVAERLYEGLSRDDQRLLERAALLPSLSPEVVQRLAGGGRTALPLSDVLTRQSDDGTLTLSPSFRQFLLGRLGEQHGGNAAALAHERREVAAVARSAGAVHEAIAVLLEGGQVAEASDLAHREADRLRASGRQAEARHLLALLPDNTPDPEDNTGVLHLAEVLTQAPEATDAILGTGRAPRVLSQLSWRPNRTVIGMGLALLALAAGWLAPAPPGLSENGWRALATLVAVVPLLALNTLPEGIVALALGAVWVVGGVAPVRVAFGGFATSGWVLVVAVLLLGAAMASSGLLYRLAMWVVAHARGGFVGQAVTLALAGVLLGPANPNATGRVMLIAPATQELVEALGYKPKRRAAVGISMAVLMGWGQIVSPFLTSSTTAILVYAVLPEAARNGLNWGTWAVRAAPTNIVLFVGLMAAIAWMYRPRKSDDGGAVDAEVANARRARSLALQQEMLGPPSRRERVTLWVTAAALVGFLLQPLHGVDPGWTAVLAVVALTVGGALTADDLRSVNWSFALFFGILPGMADVLAYVKADQWLSGLVISAVGGLTANPPLFIFVLTLLCYAISLVLRWQAAAPLMTVALAPVAQNAGMDPWIVGMVALIACNGFFLSYQSTTYLALYHGTGGRLFTHAQARPVAFAYAVLVPLALIASLPVWRAMGLLQ